MITLLIGHRGVGKTSLLKRVSDLLGEQAVCFDLDFEIERGQQKTISEIWQLGEYHFREVEKQVLARLLSEREQLSDKQPEKRVFIAVGAGFAGPWPEKCFKMWVRRESDALGRTFFDRPRLDVKVTPWDEFMRRFSVREALYQSTADWILTLPEGEPVPEIVLQKAFASSSESPNQHLAPQAIYDWTVLKKDADRTTLSMMALMDLRKQLGVRRFELRDDLLTDEEIKRWLELLPSEQVIVSCRRVRSEPTPWIRAPTKDWDLALGKPEFKPSIVSRHEGRFSDLEVSEAQGSHLKFSPLVNSFTELWQGHQWWLQDPEGRSFLPRSKAGRWQWYRILFGQKMKIHFAREGDGSALDQPYWWQFEDRFGENRFGEDAFAAVLGSPVRHSWSPLFHHQFFKNYGMPFVAVEIAEEEWEEAWPILTRLGLKFAAVTAPLKLKAAKAVTESTPDVSKTQACNTLFVDGPRVCGHNTDVLGLREMQARLVSKFGEPASVWLWGGGGVKSSVRDVWHTQLEEVSARAGTDSVVSPDLLIWAVGRKDGVQWPNERIRPKVVFDLNYGSDSPGREWAVACGLQYVSGAEFFKWQAEAQQEFWREQLLRFLERSKA